MFSRLRRYLVKCAIAGAILTSLEVHLSGMQLPEESLRNAAAATPQLKMLFDQTFSTVGPLFHSDLSFQYFVGGGFGLGYCLEYRFSDPDDSLYAPIARLIGSYRGRLEWRSESEFNNKGMCVLVGPTPRDLNQGDGEKRFTFEAIRMDAEQLCAYLANSLGPVENSAGDAETHLTHLEDPYDPGPHDIYVLQDVAAGYSAPRHAPADRLLHFSPSIPELRAIEEVAEGGKKTTSGPAQVPGSGYPLIAKVFDEYNRAVYPNSDIPALQEECNRLLRKSDSALAKTGLQKILLATAWATQFKAGLLFNPL